MFLVPEHQKPEVYCDNTESRRSRFDFGFLAIMESSAKYHMNTKRLVTTQPLRTAEPQNRRTQDPQESRRTDIMAPIICKVLNKFEEPMQGVEPSDLVPVPVDSKEYSSCRLVFMTCSHYGPNINPWPYIQVNVRLLENHDHSVRMCLSSLRYEVRVEVTPRPDTVPSAEQERLPIMAPLPSQPSLSSPWPPFLKEEAMGYWTASPAPPPGMGTLDCFTGLDNLGGVGRLEAPGEVEQPGELGEINEDPGLTREPSEKDDPDYRPPSPSACSEMSGVGHGPTVLLRPTNRAATPPNSLFGVEPSVQPERRGRPRKVQDGDAIRHGVQKAARPRRRRGRPRKDSI
ncbi:hypothetical protein CHU98_g11187 [Xylaria longipes]|nr:hypothetical protein CHU98_g11187 [Xylaria longipes]